MSSKVVLYDTIGGGYNYTRLADPYITSATLRLLSPEADGLYLDIGCGTGNYTAAFAQAGFSLIGIDPSEIMLNEASSKYPAIEWIQGKAESILLGDGIFNGITAILTIHHWHNLEAAFTELNRVLKYNSNMVIFTAMPAQMERYWLNHYFPEMMQRSILQMPGLDAIEKAAIATGLKVTGTEKYLIQENLSDLFLYAGKHRPELYLEKPVRQGISSFSALANLAGVEDGLQKLEKDIKSGEFKNVRHRFNDGAGDYMFITLKKC